MNTLTCKDCKKFKKDACEFGKTELDDPVCDQAELKTSTKLALIDKPTYEKTMSLPVGMLQAHPDALAFWAAHREKDSDEDQRALTNSVAESGVLEPLMAVAKADGTGFWVVDGCSRFAAAQECGLPEVPVSIYKMELDKVSGVAFQKNACRHRVSSGERILRYLDLHREVVLKCWKNGQDKGQTGRGHKAVSRDTAFSSKEIAERLGVSNKDVLKGIELLASCDAGGVPARAADGSTVIVPADENMQTMVRDCFTRVISGTTPIRRWQAALQGRAATENQDKASTDYAEVARRSVIGLTNALLNWDDWREDKQMEYKLKAALMKDFESLFAAMPEEIRKRALKQWKA